MRIRTNKSWRLLRLFLFIIMAPFVIMANEDPKFHSNKADGRNATVSPLTNSATQSNNSLLEYNSPCESGVDNRASELCAQWKAADSSARSAEWAKWTFFVSALGTAAIILTLIFSAKATSAAARASKVAEESLNHARDMSRLQLRAYLDINNPRIETFGNKIADDTFVIDYYIEIKNFGQTPATHIMYRDAFILSKSSPDYSVLNKEEWNDGGSLAQNDDFNFLSTIEKSSKEIGSLKTGESNLYYLLEFSYRDVFDKEYTQQLTVNTEDCINVTVDNERYNSSQLSDGTDK